MADRNRNVVSDVMTAIITLSVIGLANAIPTVSVVRRDVYLIVLKLKLTNPDTFQGMKISYKGGGADLMTNQLMQTNRTDYTVEGLKETTDYNICLIAVPKTGTGTPPKNCVKACTIAVIRTDGVIVLTVFSLYVIFCFIAGWWLWRKHKQQRQYRHDKPKRNLEHASYTNDIEDDEGLNQGAQIHPGQKRGVTTFAV